MEHVIVERVFSEPVDLAALSQRFADGAACFELRNVRILRSAVSLDGLRMLCEYSAPDAESVQAANDSAALPYERIWTARVLEPRKNG